MTPDQLAKSGSEHAQQRALFAWANMAEKYGVWVAAYDDAYLKQGWAQRNFDALPNTTNDDVRYHKLPQLKWLHAVHNQGHGDAIRGAKAKAEGVKSGVWDIFLPVIIRSKQSGYVDKVGLYIEMKVGKNKLTEEQEQFRVDNDWFCFDVCYSWREGRDAIFKYLGLG